MRRSITVLVAALAGAFAPAAAQFGAAQFGTGAARAVVERYYAAIERGDFRTAYAQWGSAGRASGKSFPAFARGFAATAHTRIVIGNPGLPDGGAGSLYVEVPVDVHAQLKNGRRQHFRGTYVVRRVNDVPGAPPASLRWHLDSARLRAVR